MSNRTWNDVYEQLCVELSWAMHFRGPGTDHAGEIPRAVDALVRKSQQQREQIRELQARNAEIVDQAGRMEASCTETIGDLRESLELCLKAMRAFDQTDYDDCGGPHLSEGISKAGRRIAELEEQVRVIANRGGSLEIQCADLELRNARLEDAIVRACVDGPQAIRGLVALGARERYKKLKAQQKNSTN